MTSVLLRSARAIGSSSSLRALGQANFSVDGSKAYKEREEAAERVFFNQEEERVLRKLASKIRAQAAQHDTEEHNKVVAKEKDALLKIVAKYKVHEKDIEALLNWKHHSY